MTHNRIKRITSHAGHARYLATLKDCGWIPKDRNIPSPYLFSPTHFVSTDERGRKVFIVETAHRTYDVFDCSQDRIFASDAEASESALEGAAMTELRIEVNSTFQPASTDFRCPAGTISITPPLDENYFIARVPLHRDQAIVAFPKFGTIGCGFAQEKDWNTNLPISCGAEKIFNHIKHNKKYRAIKDTDCIAAIKLLQEWAAALKEAKP